jgi:hypothetical protein
VENDRTLQGHTLILA